MSTPVSNHPVFITSPATDSTEPSPGNNRKNRKRHFSGHRVQPVDRENRQGQEDFREQFCESKRHPKKRQCRQRVNAGETVTSASTGRTPTEPLVRHEASALHPSVIVYPQPMDIDPGEDSSSLFSTEHPSGRPESLSVDEEPDHSEIIAKFTAAQQHQIMPSLGHPGVKAVLSNASRLLKTLEKRGIQLSMSRGTPPLPTLFSKLEQFNIATEHQICSGYFQKADVFFSAVGKTMNNTGCLTSMLRSKGSVTLFTSMTDEDVAAIAACPCLKQISSLYNGKGLPDKARVEAFLKLGCLKEGWQGNDEAVKDNPIDRTLLTNISSMSSAKGLPEKTKVEAFLTLPCLKQGWLGIDETVKDQPIDRALLTNISSMCHSKGFPEKAEVEAFLKLACLKEGWQGIDEAVQDKSLDRALVTSISSMSSGKGLPEKAKVEAFLKLACLKEGWQGIDEAVKDKPLDRFLFTRISSMCNGRGLPEKTKVATFLKLACLKEGWQGIDEAVRDKPLDRTLVTHISSMCHGKGLPEKVKTEAFLTLGCLKKGWQGIDEAVKDQPLDRALITHISSMCHGKGLPEKAKVEAFLKLACLKEGWQGIDEAVKDKPFDQVLVTSISSMSCSKGLPEKAKVEAFLKLACLKQGWQGIDEAVKYKPIDRALVTNISSMCNGKGLPEKAKVVAFLKLSCLKEGWQGIDEAVKDKPPDRSLITHISSMCNGKGLPEKASVEAFLKLACLKEGWQGVDEAVKNEPLDRALIPRISSMCHTKGLPEKAKVEAFLQLGCLKEGWQGDDEAVKDKPLDWTLISCISYLFNGKGLPEKRKVEAFLKQRAENTRDNEISVIKEEATELISLPHRINDQAPLWLAEQSVKREVGESRQRPTTFFSQINIPNDRSIRKSINESIAKYQALDDKQRELYLKERMSVQKNDGSIFSELKGQQEVVASRDISQWELLGHYAGKQYHDNTYQQGARFMGAVLANIDRYSFAPTHGVFISAFREGNITSLINAFSTYAIREKNSPEQNVSFLRHRNQQGQWVVFVIAIKPIPANESLWIDYGEQYWQAAREPIEIVDD